MHEASIGSWYKTYRTPSSHFGMRNTKSLDIRSRMTERSDRLKKAFKATGLTQVQAVERWGWNKNTFKSNLNGSVDFGFAKAKEYGVRLRVRSEWLYDGSGPMVEERRVDEGDAIPIPIISWVSAGQLAEQVEEIEPDDGNFTVLSGLPKSRYFATRVQGDSMDRYSPDGSIVIVDANDVTPRPGKAYIFSVRGEATYKVYQGDPVIHLEPHSTNPANKAIFPDGDRDWAVVGRVARTFLDLP